LPFSIILPLNLPVVSTSKTQPELKKRHIF